MAGKSLEQRVSEAEVRIRQLQARKETLEQRLRQTARKERTRRLIQIGAVMANLGVDTLVKVQAFQREVERRSEVRRWLTSVLEHASVPDDGP